MATEEEKKDTCSYCGQPPVMEVHNLQNNVKKKFCTGHFGEFVTQGQSKVYEQFLMAMQK